MKKVTLILGTAFCMLLPFVAVAQEPEQPQYWNVDDSGDRLVLGERIIVDESFSIQ